MSEAQQEPKCATCKQPFVAGQQPVYLRILCPIGMPLVEGSALAVGAYFHLGCAPGKKGIRKMSEKRWPIEGRR